MIDQEELNYIIQDIKDDINSGTTINNYPPSKISDHQTSFGRVLIDIPMRGIKFKFHDMLPYIEEVSDRLEDMDIKLVNIKVRFTDEEPTEITDLEFYEILNNGFTTKKRGEEFFKIVKMSLRTRDIVSAIDRNDNLINILIRYEYVYGDVIEKPKSLIKKFKDFFNR